MPTPRDPGQTRTGVWGLHLPPHVREHQEFDGCARRLLGLDLGAQIVRAHDIPIGGFHVDRLPSRVVDGRGHRREGEGVGEDLVARLNAHHLRTHEKWGQGGQ